LAAIGGVFVALKVMLKQGEEAALQAGMTWSTVRNSEGLSQLKSDISSPFWSAVERRAC
jgi:hypothetical protein